MKGLYAICDLDLLGQRGIDPLRFSRALLAARPWALQLRAKRAGPREAVSLLRALTVHCGEAGCLLFANDRPDLAVMAGADGVHLGQEDLPVKDARQFAAGLQIGVSTHTLAQLQSALAERPSYVAFGPVYSTSSKLKPDPVVGLAALAQASAMAKAAAVPLVAIGGIGIEQLPEIAPAVDSVAVIAGLIPSVPELDPESVAFMLEVTRLAGVYQQALTAS